MLWQAFLFGQCICLVNTGSGVFASLLASCGIQAPLYQLLWFYIGLFLIFGTLLVRSATKGAINWSWRRAAMVSVASIPDSQGCFLIILSFSYTSLTSVAVLKQSIFVMVAVMSYAFNGRRYSGGQFLGLVGALVGMVVLVLADMRLAGWKFDSSATGDLMAISGAFLLSVAYVYQERLLRKGVKEHEYLAYIAFWGALIMIAETLAVEYHEVKKIHTTEEILSVFGFASFQLGVYTATPFYIGRHGATMFNLSLIPTIVYSFLYSLAVGQSAADWLSIGGYVIVLASLFLFSLSRGVPLAEEKVNFSPLNTDI